MITVEKIVEVLTEEQKQLIKDTIVNGFWGVDETKFLNNEGKIVVDDMRAYCTNDAKKAGHFNGRKISAMFRSIYKKLCPYNGCGRYVSHCSDWWGDGTGDMLFIRHDFVDAFEDWARK